MEAFSADTARDWVARITLAVREDHRRLSDLDAAIGDGDHGDNLRRGFDAADTALASDGGSTPEFDSAGEPLVRTGTTLISTVGGASGPLLGSAFRAAGKALDGPSADAAALGSALRAGLDAIRRLGGAAPGDKTMVDAYEPAIEAFERAASDGLAAAARAAADAAAHGAEATVPLQARKGRASYLGERSKGHTDPGAASAVLIVRALAEALGDG